jgi:hypothetical protein
MIQLLTLPTEQCYQLQYLTTIWHTSDSKNLQKKDQSLLLLRGIARSAAASKIKTIESTI